MPFPFCIVGWCNNDVAARCMEAFSIGKLGRFTIKAIWFCVLENNLDYCGMGARSSSPTSSDSLSLSLFIKRIRMCSLDLAIAHIHRNHKPFSLPRISLSISILSLTHNVNVSIYISLFILQQHNFTPFHVHLLCLSQRLRPMVNICSHKISIVSLLGLVMELFS